MSPRLFSSIHLYGWATHIILKWIHCLPKPEPKSHCANIRMRRDRKKNRFAQTKRSKRVLQLEISIFIRSSIKILINQAEYVHNSDTYILDTIDPINLRAVYVPRNPSSRILRIIACIETCTTCVCVCVDRTETATEF